MQIEYPVKLTQDSQIVDKFNRTVVPDLTWKGDLLHVKHQREVGELLVNLMNVNHENQKLMEETVVSGSLNPLQDTVKSTVEAVLSDSKPKRRGNPWGRKGRPKT